MNYLNDCINLFLFLLHFLIYMIKNHYEDINILCNVCYHNFVLIEFWKVSSMMMSRILKWNLSDIFIAQEKHSNSRLRDPTSFLVDVINEYPAILKPPSTSWKQGYFERHPVHGNLSRNTISPVFNLAPEIIYIQQDDGATGSFARAITSRRWAVCWAWADASHVQTCILGGGRIHPLTVRLRARRRSCRRVRRIRHNPQGRNGKSLGVRTRN